MVCWMAIASSHLNAFSSRSLGFGLRSPNLPISHSVQLLGAVALSYSTAVTSPRLSFHTVGHETCLLSHESTSALVCSRVHFRARLLAPPT